MVSATSKLARSSLPNARLERVLGSTRYRTPDAIETLRVSPDGRWIFASLSGNDRRHWLFDARSGAVRARIEAVDVAFDQRAAGDYFVLRNGELQRWSATLGAQIDTVMRCADAWGANIDPYGRGVVVDGKGFVRRDGTVLALAGLAACPRGAFTRDEFVCAMESGAFARYSLDDGARTVLGGPYTPDASEYLIAVSPDQTRVAIRTAMALFLVDLATNKARTFFELAFNDRGRWSNPIALSDDGCAVGTDEGVALVHRQTGRRRAVIRTPKVVTQLAFSPTKDGLLWCSRNDDLRYSPDGDCLLAWQPEKRVRVSPPDRGHVDRVDGVTFATLDGREQAFTTSCDGAVKRWPLDARAPNAVDCFTVVPTERLEVAAGVLSVSESEFDGAGGFARFASITETGDRALRDLRREFERARDRGEYQFELGQCSRLSADGARVARILKGYAQGASSMNLCIEPVFEGADRRDIAVIAAQPTEAFLSLEWLDARRVMVIMAASASIYDVDTSTLLQRYEHAPWPSGTTAAPLSDRECLRYDWNGNLQRVELSTDRVMASTKRSVRQRYPLVFPTLRLSRDRSLVVVNSRAGAHVYRTDTLRRVARLRFAKNAGPLCAAAISDDNRRVIVGCKRGVALVYALSSR